MKLVTPVIPEQIMVLLVLNTVRCSLGYICILSTPCERLAMFAVANISTAAVCTAGTDALGIHRQAAAKPTLNPRNLKVYCHTASAPYSESRISLIEYSLWDF